MLVKFFCVILLLGCLFSCSSAKTTGVLSGSNLNFYSLLVQARDVTEHDEFARVLHSIRVIIMEETNVIDGYNSLKQYKAQYIDVNEHLVEQLRQRLEACKGVNVWSVTRL